MTGPPNLTLPAPHWQRLKNLAEAGYPHEICALMIGHGDRTAATVTDVIPAANVHHNPRTRFEVDPAVLLRSHREAREGGRQLLGVFHTHPDHTAEMSQTDLSRAAYAPPWWMISAVIGGSAQIPKAFLWRGQGRGVAAAYVVLT